MMMRIRRALPLLLLMLSGCSLVPNQASTQVEISPNTFVTLPKPAQLGYQVTASQLISAHWQDDNGQHNQQLPVQLQVTDDKIVLAGFSSWGTRILSLNYQQDTIETSVLTGLENTLPKPEQILFNLMITLWPRNAWEASLNKVKWQIIDDENRRTLINELGETVIVIDYQHPFAMKGDICFHNQLLNYTITIKTLSAQHPLPPTQP
ncbi:MULTISPECIES: DUF3261 domain-containing protein [unclassified Vibrio]|uniref:DUF3261 domain-containing protein n=1 Tax=unclassified Vibrio TaxID=2614977 RepID=UPI000B8E5095|nr:MULTISPECIES: DUF3261 domain-containing protein [unclassified Vibrio]NAX43317.1 DUF3261 domain-containing protein [Vibrio sp. V25_P4S6T154]OXX45896.1 hypothetical protein B9J93_10275 [Vibrio sp. V17_P4S1T151]OXX59815.1 hypothetical protein B9J89_22855 [Vibrio sp. V15_P4S5T153]OXX68535.1 hypothetical protein B9J94_07790 [Vibrio sp. V20_P4S3T152]